MPPVKYHTKSSLKRTGKEYRELHEWMDSEYKNSFGLRRHEIINIPEFMEENSKSQLVNMRYSSDINTLRMKLGKHVAKLDKSNSVDEKKEEAFVKLSFPQENIPLLPVASVEIDKEQREQIAKQIDKEGNYLFDVIIPKMGVHTQHQYKPHAIFYHAFEIPNGQLVFNWLYNKVTNAEENQTNEDYGTMQPVSFQAP